ncbi:MULTISPECIES: IS3 family transposase [Bacillaceae]|uniref:IS3 family transposase n=1 Tax=Bacillaceae TaxID=186817 RepID=UPI001F1705A8|nr:IS3 family transposase [Litchfieldia alkalitelluris]
MDTHRDEHTVVKMCKVLKVSVSGYYKWVGRQRQGPTEKEIYRQELCQKINKSFHESFGTYGSPRIHADLIEWGYTVSQKTVARLMKEMGLKATQEQAYVVTTDSNHELPLYTDLVKRNFTVDEPDRLWVTDITYIRTVQGWVYLATVMDLFSRKIVGWYMADHMRVELCSTALKMALVNRSPSEKLIHHSDRGSQYCSKEYIDLLKEEGCQISMSRKGNPYDNACIESFHATIKKELIYRRRFNTKAEAMKAVNYYISARYNKRRRHSTLGYVSPDQYEFNFLAGQQLKAS